jgi:Core-2/I-Branching enzyme
MIKFAFVVLSHNNPGQLLRLTKVLGRLYDNPRIVCHHNFGLCRLELSEFPSACRFLHPHIDTRWGDISVVRAGLSAIEMLYRCDGWDWFFLLSGSDYPVATPESIRSELLSADFDVLLDNRLVEYDRRAIEGPDEQGQFTFSRPYWCSLAYDRYLTYHAFPYPSLTKRFGRCKRWLRIRDPMWLKLLGKWPNAFRVYGGDMWFGGNRRTAEILLRHPEQQAILTFFSSKFIPDEAAFHTLICNSDLAISRLGSRRFSKWPDVNGHPKWLAKEDFTEITTSNAWFARKFLPDDPVLDLLDEHLRTK